jgi:hypothetical protein
VALVNYVFRFLSALAVLREELVELRCDVGFASAAQRFACSALAFSIDRFSGPNNEFDLALIKHC